ncbi:hypothetical protein LTS10_006183 [Elasticomyces elasticus]|nr:hypothetical protein LTS10_006183 [Elasticomyces elasticus]
MSITNLVPTADATLYADSATGMFNGLFAQRGSCAEMTLLELVDTKQSTTDSVALADPPGSTTPPLSPSPAGDVSIGLADQLTAQITNNVYATEEPTQPAQTSASSSTFEPVTPADIANYVDPATDLVPSTTQTPNIVETTDAPESATAVYSANDAPIGLMDLPTAQTTDVMYAFEETTNSAQTPAPVSTTTSNDSPPRSTCVMSPGSICVGDAYDEVSTATDLVPATTASPIIVELPDAPNSATAQPSVYSVNDVPFDLADQPTAQTMSTVPPSDPTTQAVQQTSKAAVSSPAIPVTSASTVPDASQTTSGEALSSSSLSGEETQSPPPSTQAGGSTVDITLTSVLATSAASTLSADQSPSKVYTPDESTQSIQSSEAGGVASTTNAGTVPATPEIPRSSISQDVGGIIADILASQPSQVGQSTVTQGSVGTILLPIDESSGSLSATATSTVLYGSTDVFSTTILYATPSDPLLQPEPLATETSSLVDLSTQSNEMPADNAFSTPGVTLGTQIVPFGETVTLDGTPLAATIASESRVVTVSNTKYTLSSGITELVAGTQTQVLVSHTGMGSYIWSGIGETNPGLDPLTGTSEVSRTSSNGGSGTLAGVSVQVSTSSQADISMATASSSVPPSSASTAAGSTATDAQGSLAIKLNGVMVGLALGIAFTVLIVV